VRVRKNHLVMVKQSQAVIVMPMDVLLQPVTAGVRGRSSANDLGNWLSNMVLKTRRRVIGNTVIRTIENCRNQSMVLFKISYNRRLDNNKFEFFL